MSDARNQMHPSSGLSAPQGKQAEHFPRPRLQALLAEAVQKPLVLVRAGMGHGKTLAVADFVRESGIPTVWIRLSGCDNVGLSFWENAIRSIRPIHKPFAEECEELGFPNTEDKQNQLFLMRDRAMARARYIWVLDDMHLINNPAVLNILESSLYRVPENHTYIVICRELPKINLSGLLVRGMIANIDEKDLSFSESEVSQYLLQQGLSKELPNLSQIFLDTKGWAFIVNFLVRILKKTPGYTRYARRFMKQNLFQLMEKEIWSTLSERLQHFLVRFPLVNSFPASLVSLLAEEDESLLAEFNQQRTAYIRFDEYGGYYLVHHLFLDYLRSKQGILGPSEVCDTYKKAADWCARNGRTSEALTYYETIGDYKSLVPIIRDSPLQLLLSIISHVKGIFDRAPAEVFDQVEFFATSHVRVLILADLWQDALERVKWYERKFLLLPENDEFKHRALGVLYYLWGLLRQLMCTADDIYDFDVYFEKMSHYPVMLARGQARDTYPIGLGPWINRVGVARQGAPQEYLKALARSARHMSKGGSNWDGLDDLCRSELLFYQGEVNAAKSHIKRILERTKNDRQFVVAHLALFYAMRIAAWQGNYEKMEQALKGLEASLEENDRCNRFTTYDVALGTHYSILRLPEKIPGWLKEKLAPCSRINFLENFGNLIKAHYCYLIKKHDILLTYLEERKQWEVPVYSRTEMLAMKACVHYQMKDKQSAFAVLQEAYGTASPNGIIAPFVELGKDMRTLTLAALREPDCHIPQMWLKTINQKSSVYARQQTRLISEYKKNNNINIGINLTPRETNVMHDLYKGFSRSEIAARQDLSINTVRLVVNRIYEKLQARNLIDLIRIIHEQKLI